MMDPVLLAVYFVVGAVGVTQLPILVDILDNLFPTLKIGRLSRYAVPLHGLLTHPINTNVSTTSR